MTAIFRPYSRAEGLRSDRSAGDRLRHRIKVRQSIRDNIADIVAEESIIGRSGDKVIKVPIRTIKEYRFVYGDNEPKVGEGGGDAQPGQKVGKGQGDQPGPGQAGDQPGVDYYETDITLDELIDIMFEDLELPDLERRSLRETPIDSAVKRKGYRSVGIRSHLDRKRSMRTRLRRKVAAGRGAAQATAQFDNERFPFRKEDLRYRRRKPDIRTESNAVVLCIMDTSGSMDTMKKYLARSFFFLLYQFVRTRYQNVELVFVTHDSRAREVTEDEFFHKGESGGTLVSSGYLKALEVINDRFHPSLWNVYAFHCSDGDNMGYDNPTMLRAARELCDTCNLFGYGEIKPGGFSFTGNTLLSVFKELERDNFQTVAIDGREDVWPAFKTFLAKDRVEA